MTASDDPAEAVHVLVVEDSRTQAMKLKAALERHGYTVDWAASAESALDDLARRMPDVVIADYHLPGMNGDGLVRQIRLNVRTRTLPVLMLTETRERDLEKHGLESGADAYVAKPAPEDMLLMRIRALLRRRRESDRDGESGEGAVFRRSSLLVVGPPSGTDRLAAAFAHDAYAVATVPGPEEALALAADPAAAIDCILVAADGAFCATALCRDLDALRVSAGGTGQLRGFLIVVAAHPGAGASLADVYAAGADDVVPTDADPEVLGLRVRALVRRKQLMDDDRRIDRERRERRIALDRAEAATAAAEAKAALAADLEAANARLRETQSQLVHAAKMSSLGELVAGIAHEINNPLAFILAHHRTVERLIVEVGDDPAAAGAAPRLAKALDRLRATGLGLHRIQELVLNLRRFSRLDEGQVTEIDVHASIDTVLQLLAHKIGPGVTVTRDYRGEKTIVCAAALLNQVVMNIVSNAADAVGESGTITVTTDSEPSAHVITVTDSGPGVPAEIRDRIFEPFFTTKPVGAGTGLGLAISYGVVAAHGGTIAVEDGPGGGARFVIRIPRRRP